MYKYVLLVKCHRSLSLFSVTGQWEPSACVRLKPSPRQTLSKNGTLCLCYNAETQWLWGKEQHSIRNCINQAVRSFEKKQYILIVKNINSVINYCIPLVKNGPSCVFMQISEYDSMRRLSVQGIGLLKNYSLIKSSNISIFQIWSAVTWPKRIFI